MKNLKNNLIIPKTIIIHPLCFRSLFLFSHLLLFSLFSLLFNSSHSLRIMTNDYMLQSMEAPDCIYSGEAVSIPPSAPTPKHSLYLSNLDDQNFLRFSIKYLYLFHNSFSFDLLKSSLGRVLVDYYPLAGRLRTVDHNKLEVDCNGQGALFAQAFTHTTLHQLLESSKTPNKSWKKFLYKVEAHTFVDVPPLIVQVRLTISSFIFLNSSIQIPTTK